VLINFNSVPFLQVAGSILVTIPCSLVTAPGDGTITVVGVDTRCHKVKVCHYKTKSKCCHKAEKCCKKKEKIKHQQPLQELSLIRYTVPFTLTPPVTPPIVIPLFTTGIIPATGTVGAEGTITGTGFVPGSTVTIGGVVVTDFTVVSGTTITFTVPDGTPLGPNDIVVTNPDGGTATSPIPFTVTGACAPVPAPLATFSVLGASTVTNTGLSALSDSVGVSPGTAITGFPPGIVGGTIQSNTADAILAQAQATTLYNFLAAQPPAFDITGVDLSGQLLIPGVYISNSGGIALGGAVPLVLDAGGDPNARFIFQSDSTLTTATGSVVTLINGANACNVFWQVTSSATLGTISIFAGTVVATTSITATTGATINGRLIALNAAVTLDTNTINTPLCAFCA
jgi:hypothetical protein